jgi:hypothetical protein
VVLAVNSEPESSSAGGEFRLPRGGEVSSAHDVGGLEAFRSLGEIELDGLAFV